MISLRAGAQPVTNKTIARRRTIDFIFMYLAVMGGGLFVAAFAWTRSWQPYIGVSMGVLLLTWLAWAIRPRLGLNLTLFFALLGDIATVAWFPFNKNLSSHESIMWLSDSATFTPLELTLVVALVIVAMQRWSRHRKFFASGPINWSLAILVVATVGGFMYGVLRGGDLRVAIFEVRPLLYFPMVYLLTISVCDHVSHYRQLLFTALAAITTQSLLSAHHALGLSAAERDELESLTEHGSSISMNLLFVTLIVSLGIRGIPWVLRLSLFAASLPVLWVYLLSQRRIAFVALVTALILFSVILFWRQRRTFWFVVPLVAIVGLGYVGAFWNSSSPIGFPAQAVKTVIAPDDLSAADQSSDDYRRVENFNLQATIRSSPALGVGFGQPFLRPFPLPDISRFEFHEYVPHNSVLYLWIKTGIVGFVAFYFSVAKSIVLGVDRVRRQAIGIDFVVSVAGLLFVVMFAMYLIGDIAWEPRNPVLFGIFLALSTSAVGLDPPQDSSRQLQRPQHEQGEGTPHGRPTLMLAN